MRVTEAQSNTCRPADTEGDVKCFRFWVSCRLDVLMRFRYAIRSLVRDPAFIFVAIVVLSLGIAANTTAFAVIDQVILDPLPIEMFPGW